MTQASDTSSILAFKEVSGGFIYRAPSPLVFGKRDHFLVDAEQRARILAASAEKWSARSVRLLVAGMMVLLCAWIVVLNFFFSGFQNTIWVGTMALLLLLSIAGQSLLARRALRRVQPILDGAKRTDQKVTLDDMLQAQAATRSPLSYAAQRRGCMLAAGACVASVIAIAAMLMEQKSGAFRFSAPMAIFAFNAVLNGHLAYVSWRSLRLLRSAAEAGVPTSNVAAPMVSSGVLKYLGGSMLIYLMVVAVLGVRSEFSSVSWAQRFAAAGDHKAAIAELTKAIDATPDNAIALLARGRSSIAIGDNVAAIGDLSRVIELQPNTADAYRLRGQANRQAGRHDGAIADYTRVIELDPADHYANYFRGVSFAAQKRNDAAIADFTRAIEIRPTDFYAYLSRARSLSAKGETEKAIMDASKAIEINPKYANAYLLRANVYTSVKKYAEAIADYARYIEIEPADVSGYISRANAYIGMSNLDAAIVNLSKAIEIAPANAGVLISRAKLHERKGAVDQAIRDYEAMLSLPASTAADGQRQSQARASIARLSAAAKPR